MELKISAVSGADAIWFHRGTATRCYEYFGVHRVKDCADFTYDFRVYAPTAERVELCGDFNGTDVMPMTCADGRGIWEIRYKSDIPIEGMRYSYSVTCDGVPRQKADPFARSFGYGGSRESIVTDGSDYEWGDSAWISNRRHTKAKGPVNIYLVHLGSFITCEGKCNVGGDAYHNYRTLADELRDHVLDMGYTHVQLTPVNEYPKDSSLGYLATGYFAPSSRYGTPEDFKYFVDTMHKSGIGVIIEWNPVSFAQNAYFACESYGPVSAERRRGAGDVGFFDQSRPEVRSFLLSSAVFWVSEFHIDGLAVRSKCKKKEGSEDGLCSFFDFLNGTLNELYPGVMTVFCESWLKRDCGFDMYWDIGFTNGLLECVAADPYTRWDKYKTSTACGQNKLNIKRVFPIIGRGGLPSLVFGSYEDKFATIRALFGYVMCLPGCKLFFMGSELGQFREWDCKNQLDWFLEDIDSHRQLMEYVRRLNGYYMKKTELWETDYIEWMSTGENHGGVLAFKRYSRKGKELLCVVNLSTYYYPELSISTGSEHVFYREELNSDGYCFGGRGRKTQNPLAVEDSFITAKIPPLSFVSLSPMNNIRVSKAKI